MHIASTSKTVAAVFLFINSFYSLASRPPRLTARMLQAGGIPSAIHPIFPSSWGPVDSNLFLRGYQFCLQSSGVPDLLDCDIGATASCQQMRSCLTATAAATLPQKSLMPRTNGCNAAAPLARSCGHPPSQGRMAARTKTMGVMMKGRKLMKKTIAGG